MRSERNHVGRPGWLVVAMLAATLAAVPPAAGQDTIGAAGGGELSAALQPGDAIRLGFWREPALSGEYQLDESGTVVLPYLGARSVAGVEPLALRRRLAEEYAGVLENQAVEIGLLRRIRILGAVRNPGLYRVDATMTLADALALAGGLAPNGRPSGIRVVRAGEVIPVDLSSGAPAGLTLRSGDQITVAETGWFARNSGALLGAAISALAFLVGQAVF
jgi:protein involved in polysaccharide export with SLBB domain